MKPDHETAAISAAETLIKHKIIAAPIAPLAILKTIPGVLVQSYTELANLFGVDRSDIISTIGIDNQGAVTFAGRSDAGFRYMVAYNQRLPFYMLQRSLARELGHVVLGHDGSRPGEVRDAEASCFAWHLLCPRPLLHAVQAAGIPLTVDMIGNMTGCYERCQSFIREMPGVHVPAALNSLVRDQFADYTSNLIAYRSIIADRDTSPLADLGTYMDNYEE